MKVRVIMNLNSLLAGFVGGIICSTVLFVISRALMLPKMLKAEKVKDLSYFGRQPVKLQVKQK